MIEPASWWLFPVGLLIAVVYTSTGVSGANFWVPVYVLWLRVDPRIGFWLALLTMLFGSASGLLRHARQRTIELRVALRLSAVAVPAAVAGAFVAPHVPTGWLLTLFGGFCTLYGLVLSLGRSVAVARPAPWAMAAAGGACTGLITVGVGALLAPRLLAGRPEPHRAAAVGTALVVVFLASLAATLARLEPRFVEQLAENRQTIVGIMLVVAPAVQIGGQLGPWVARRLSGVALRRYVGLVLLTVGLSLLARLAAQ